MYIYIYIYIYIYMYVCIYTTSSLSIHLSMDFRCFYVLATTNSAAINIEVRVSFWIRVFSRYMVCIYIVFSRYMPRSGSSGNSIFSFSFLLINLFLNWRIIALQNFVVFCQALIWISQETSILFSIVVEEPPDCFPLVGAPMCIPINSVGGLHFLHTLPSIYCL